MKSLSFEVTKESDTRKISISKTRTLRAIFKERCFGQDSQCSCLTESFLKSKIPFIFKILLKDTLQPYLVVLDFQIAHGKIQANYLSTECSWVHICNLIRQKSLELLKFEERKKTPQTEK